MIRTMMMQDDNDLWMKVSVSKLTICHFGIFNAYHDPFQVLLHRNKYHRVSLFDANGEMYER